MSHGMTNAPTPWTQYQLGTTIYGADGFYVGITQGTNAKDDAALIVAAVNSYAAFETAQRSALERIEVLSRSEAAIATRYITSQAEITRLREALETIQKFAKATRPDPQANVPAILHLAETALSGGQP